MGVMPSGNIVIIEHEAMLTASAIDFTDVQRQSAVSRDSVSFVG